MVRIGFVGSFVVGLMLLASSVQAQVAPSEVSAGERMTVTRGTTGLMRGTQSLGTLTRGQSFEVLRVQGGWLGAKIQVDGEERAGWVWHGHVRPEGTAAAESAPPVYRRYSYEPTVDVLEPVRTTPRVQSGSSGTRRASPPQVRLRPGSGR